MVLIFPAVYVPLTGAVAAARVWRQPSPSRGRVHGWWTKCCLGMLGIEGAGKRTSDQRNTRTRIPQAPGKCLIYDRLLRLSIHRKNCDKHGGRGLSGAMPSYTERVYKRGCRGPCILSVRRANGGSLGTAKLLL